MNKRMILLGAAVLASLAFSTPSQAGTYLVEAQSTFTISGTTATALDVTLGGSGTISALSTTSTAIPPATAMISGADTIHVTFNAALTTATFDFFYTATGTTLGAILNGNSQLLTYTNASNLSGVSGGTTILSATAVPEPSSIALLGIGLSGFIAFRRRFSRKLPVA